MRILFVAALHHPEELRADLARLAPGETPPLFPRSMAQYSQARALQKRGHVVDVFYRNRPVLGGSRHMERHSQSINARKIVTGVMQRIPAQLNPEIRLRNRRLIDKALAFRPDVLWVTGDNTVIYPETLAAIQRETDCKIVYTCGTSPIVFSHPVERRAARLYDLVIANDYYHGIQWLELGAKRMECLPGTACDPELHRPYDLSDEERKAYTCDIAFVGTLVPDSLYSRRVRALESLRDFDLGIWTVHEVPDSLRSFVRGRALGETTLRIMSAAKINLNVHGDFMRYGGNLRLFEAASVRRLQIADRLPGTLQWFSEGETIVTFADLDDLREKVSYYLAHDDERERIAQQAQAHVYQHHTYDRRIAQAEKLIEELDT
jgi:spore maturation protein CgeB